MTDQDMEPEVQQTAGEGEGSGWLGRLVGVLFRLLLVAILGIALGVGLYLGVPALVQAWMEPIEANSAQIEQLAEDIDRLQEQQAESFEGLSERVAALEGRTTSQQETLTELNSRADLIEEDLSSVQGQLDRVAGLSDQLSDLEASVSELQLELEAVVEAEAEPSAELQSLTDRLQRLRAMTLISRARLELLRGNYGLAQENLEEARATFNNQLLAEDSPTLSVLERLDLAIETLPDNPSVAAQDLEAAWRLLIEIDSNSDLN